MVAGILVSADCLMRTKSYGSECGGAGFAASRAIVLPRLVFDTISGRKDMWAKELVERDLEHFHVGCTSDRRSFAGFL